MPTVDFWSKEVLGGRSGRVSIVVQLPENPELYFPLQAVVYNRADGKFYQLSGEGWAVISSLGVEDFVGLTDTPGAYAGEGQKIVRVNAGETGLEFVEAAADFATAGQGALADSAVQPEGATVTVIYDAGWPAERPVAATVLAVGHTTAPAWLTADDVWFEEVS